MSKVPAASGAEPGHPALQRRSAPGRLLWGSLGDRASLFPRDTIFPHPVHLSCSIEKISECPISSEIRGEKKKEGKR